MHPASRCSPTGHRSLGSNAGTTGICGTVSRLPVRFHRCRVSATTVCEQPSRRATIRDVRASGVDVRMLATISPSSTAHGRPVRARSSNPSSPSAAYRLRHVLTVCRETPSRRAMSALRSPSAASSTIEARNAC